MIVFEDPPEVEHRAWRDRLAPLVERPGEWARVHMAFTQRSASESVYRLRTRQATVPDAPGSWEFRWARLDGDWWVYARYTADDWGQG